MNPPDKLTHESAAEILLAGARLCSDELHLAPGGCRIRVRSNSAEYIAHLRSYFAHVVAPRADAAVEVIAVEREAIDPQAELGVDLMDWRRKPGRTGRKDSYAELPGARLICKVRTGMMFLQGAATRIAAGPCRQYDSQVINFINSQYMNWLQHRGWHICHASGLVRSGRTLGIAGFSGGGKSTFMLRLLEHSEINYLTNDRLFIRRNGEVFETTGIPKLPRINPGTIVHNPRLHPLIPQAQRTALLALPDDELWHLEQKHEVLIEQLYGTNRITLTAPLGAFLVLNWKRKSKHPLRVERIDLANRRNLLRAIMKSPGPFYQYPDGSFLANDAELDEAVYLEQLQGVPVFAATGAVSFEALEQAVFEQVFKQTEA